MFGLARLIIAPDISYFQRHLDLTFNRRVLIMRVTFSPDFIDPAFLPNSIVAAQLYKEGKIDGVFLYTVFLTSYTPAQQFDAVWKAIGPNVPDWLLGIMPDVEAWAGTSYAIHGNHSDTFNNLAGRHVREMGSWNSVPWYGNEGDLASIIPQRDPRLWGILAAYSGDLHFKRIKGARGQQYSNGQILGPVVDGRRLPISTKPFGNCDHNALAFKDGAALRAFMRPGTSKPPVKHHPKPPVKQPHYDPKRGNELVAPAGAYATFLRDDGELELRHNGHSVGTYDLTKTGAK